MPDFSSLTERQREIYDFIQERIEHRGYPPTVREIGVAFNIKSPNGVMCHLKALEKKGLIKREGFSRTRHSSHRPPPRVGWPTVPGACGRRFAHSGSAPRRTPRIQGDVRRAG